MQQPRKSYKYYLKVASNQILIKRGKCLHAHQKWEDEKVLYFRCNECGGFIAFRNPEDIKRVGEIAAEDGSIDFPSSHIEHIHLSSPPIESAPI